MLLWYTCAMIQESNLRLSLVVLSIGLLVLIFVITAGMQALPQSALGAAIFVAVLLLVCTGVGFLVWLVRKLEISEDRLNSIVETTADGIATVDVLGKIETVNSSLCGIFGYRPGELTGSAVTVLFSSAYGEMESEPYLLSFLQRHGLHQLGLPHHAVGLRRDGSTFHMDVTITQTVLGERDVFVVVARDVTERMNAQQALQESYSELERRVQIRTSELEDANLRLHGEIEERKRTQQERERLIAELQTAMGEIKTLSGMLPICANCKKIRDDTGYWDQLEVYIQKHSGAKFSHGICPACVSELYPDLGQNRKKSEDPL